MRRWLGLILAIGLVSTSASAQVFKPKSKKAAAAEKKSADPAKKAAKKQPRAGATKKRPKKKTTASDRDVRICEAWIDPVGRVRRRRARNRQPLHV